MVLYPVHTHTLENEYILLSSTNLHMTRYIVEADWHALCAIRLKCPF